MNIHARRQRAADGPGWAPVTRANAARLQGVAGAALASADKARAWLGYGCVCGLLLVLAGCGGGVTPAPTAAGPSGSLRVYGWAGYMPQSVLADFQREYGVSVEYLTYDNQEAATDDLRQGGVYDVVILGNEYVPPLAAEGRLAAIDYRHVPNFKNIAANFRDLAYDPGNVYTIPFQWGTTGLLVNTAWVAVPVARWADLWNPSLPGQIAIRPITRDVISIALKALGYSINTEQPAELEEALSCLRQLKPKLLMLGGQLATAVEALAGPRVSVAYGWPLDLLEARTQSLPIAYVLPAEGTILWGENLAIPAASANRYAAEAFLDFILRPEIGARFVNELQVASPNEAAGAFIDPAILSDEAVMPSAAALANAELLRVLSPAGEQAHAALWDRFLADDVPASTGSPACPLAP